MGMLLRLHTIEPEVVEPKVEEVAEKPVKVEKKNPPKAKATKKK